MGKVLNIWKEKKNKIHEKRNISLLFTLRFLFSLPFCSHSPIYVSFFRPPPPIPPLLFVLEREVKLVEPSRNQRQDWNYTVQLTYCSTAAI